MPSKRHSKAVWISETVLAGLKRKRDEVSQGKARQVPLTEFIEDVLWNYLKAEPGKAESVGKPSTSEKKLSDKELLEGGIVALAVREGMSGMSLEFARLSDLIMKELARHKKEK